MPSRADDHEKGVVSFGKNAHGLISDVAREQRKPEGKIAVFQGYLKYQKRFDVLCNGVGEDGRKGELFALLDGQAEKVDGCIACAPLMKSFAKSCQPPRPWEKAKLAAAPSGPIYRQREPHIKVVRGASSLFRDICGDKSIRIESYKAIQKLLKILRDPQGKSPGEVDYFGILADVIEGPAKELFALLDQEGVSDRLIQPTPTPAVNIDELF